VRIVLGLCAAALCAWSQLGLQPALAEDVASSAEAVAFDVQDVIILAPLRPLVVRLRLEIDGQPFRLAFRRRFDLLFDHHDKDRDGTLTAADAGKLARSIAGQNAESDVRRSLETALKQLPSAAGVERAPLLALVEKYSFPFALSEGLTIGRGAAPALFPLLDTNKDDKLSAKELEDAEAQLMCRDFDDDRVITEVELLASPKLLPRDFETEAQEPARTWATDAALLAGAAADANLIAQALIKRYDVNGDQRLATGGAQPEISESNIVRLDADSDGALTPEELKQVASVEPDVGLEISFGRPTGNRVRSRTTRLSAGNVRVRRKLDGGYKVQLQGLEIDMVRNNRNPLGTAADIRFANYDFDANGYIDAKESSMVRRMRDAFAAMDADGDKKVLPGEFQAHFDSQAGAAAARFTMTVYDRGQDLFTLMDSNGDSTLSTREMREAAKLIAADDRDGDSSLAGPEIPQRIRLELGRGEGPAADPTRQTLASLRTRTLTPRTASTAGPRWMQRMDRNKDGELSAAEFLGPPEAFTRLDADGDGFIVASEAAAPAAK